MTMKNPWSDVDKPGICRVSRDFSATGIPFMKWLASLCQVVIAKWVGLERMYMPWWQVAIIVFLLLLLVLILRPGNGGLARRAKFNQSVP
jgi:hypothetical protein